MSDYPVNIAVRPQVQAFFDEATNTISYIVKDPASQSCAIIDSVMDIDEAAGYVKWLIDQPKHVSINEISIDPVQK